MHLEMEAFSFGIAIYSLDLMNGVYLMTCLCLALRMWPGKWRHPEKAQPNSRWVTEYGGIQSRTSLTSRVAGVSATYPAAVSPSVGDNLSHLPLAFHLL